MTAGPGTVIGETGRNASLVVLLIAALIVACLVVKGVPGKDAGAKDAAGQFGQAVEQRTNEYVDGYETP